MDRWHAKATQRCKAKLLGMTNGCKVAKAKKKKIILGNGSKEIVLITML